MVIMNRETIFLSAAARQLLVRLAFAPVYQRAQPQTHLNFKPFQCRTDKMTHIQGFSLALPLKVPSTKS